MKNIIYSIYIESYDKNLIDRHQFTKLQLKKHYHVLEVGSGPGILLTELKKIYPNIKMTGLEPLSSGYDRYQNINENIKKSNNNIQDFNILN